MRRENYSRYLWAILALSILILVAFQLYINREPARIETVRAADRAAEISAGEDLYQANCASCHGEQGLGVDAPALNNLAILRDTPDETLFDLTVNGVPGTEMPAWGQARGGPFTDEQVRQMVAYIRSWEPTAPDLGEQRMRVDPQRGAQIYATTCVVCHGENGQGGSAPALNAPAKLQQFDNDWYAETIAKGRPAQGMPVWGTVLSPQQIGDLVAMIDVWRRGEEIIAGDVATLLKDAGHALEHGEVVEAVELLDQTVDSAEHEQAEVIEAAIAALDAGNTQEAATLIEQAQGMAGGTAAPEADEHDEEAPAEEEHTEEAPRMEETSEAGIEPGAAYLQEAVHALERDELDEAQKALTEAMELLPPGELFEAAEHGLEDLEADKAGEALRVLEDALTAAGIPLLLEEEEEAEAEEAQTAEKMPEATGDPGIAHLQEAVHALEHDELDEAQKALTEAMELLPPGELFEAAEHGLEDLEADNPAEALEVLLNALETEGIPLPEEEDETEAEEASAVETAETPADPGVAHLQEAVHALEHNELDEAEKALAEAMELLPAGDLFEAAEHALEDIEAGKPDEARQTLEKALEELGVF